MLDRLGYHKHSKYMRKVRGHSVTGEAQAADSGRSEQYTETVGWPDRTEEKARLWQEIVIIIINLIYIAQFHTNGILTALYIIIKST